MQKKIIETLDASKLFNDRDAQAVVAHKRYWDEVYCDPSYDKKAEVGREGYAHLPWFVAYRIAQKKDQAKVLKYLLLSVWLDWPELTEQLKRTVKTVRLTQEDVQNFVDSIDQAQWATLEAIVKKAVADNENNNSATITEAIEKHDKLNPKLWQDDNTLKPEVVEKINEIVDMFLKNLEDDEITINVKDIVILGSNASYNYTDDSDLDLHIIANHIDCPEDLYSKIYSAYRNIFNSKFDIDFYGIPVEIYVELANSNTKSNGIYSIKNANWVKEPVPEDIPEINQEAFDTELENWADKLDEAIESQDADTMSDCIEDLYELRKNSIADEGEYSVGNLVFKELRNTGKLDELKAAKIEALNKSLSLESWLKK